VADIYTTDKNYKPRRQVWHVRTMYRKRRKDGHNMLYL